MIKKWLASVGLGSAKVDTQLESGHLFPGEPFLGKVVIEGGSTSQQVDRINLFIMTEAVRERDDKKVYEKVNLASFTVGESFTIGEGEKKEIDFQFILPVNIPPTLGRTKVWIQTGLDVPNAVDPKDRDFVEVEPHPAIDTVLEALTDVLGFRLRKVDMEYSRRHQYVQEFEFLPERVYQRDLDELEALFFLTEGTLELVLQVDRRAKGLGGLLSEAMDMDESYSTIRFTFDELERGTVAVAEKIQQVIDQSLGNR